MLTYYVCSTKIGEISDIFKCFENFVSQALGVLTRIYAAELRDSTFSLRDMMIKVLLISLIYNMSIGLWSPPVGDKFDKELFDRYQKNGSYEYHHKENTILLYDTGNTYKKSIFFIMLS